MLAAAPLGVASGARRLLSGGRASPHRGKDPSAQVKSIETRSDKLASTAPSAGPGRCLRMGGFWALPPPFSALPGSGVGSGRFGPGRSLGCTRSLAPYRVASCLAQSRRGSLLPGVPRGAAAPPTVRAQEALRSLRGLSALHRVFRLAPRSWTVGARRSRNRPPAGPRPLFGSAGALPAVGPPPFLSVGRRCAPSAHRRGWRGRPGSPGPSCAGLAVGACLPFRRAPMVRALAYG
jgi:hypothetical protein